MKPGTRFLSRVNPRAGFDNYGWSSFSSPKLLGSGMTCQIEVNNENNNNNNNKKIKKFMVVFQY
jgi:hypothetical protein